MKNTLKTLALGFVLAASAYSAQASSIAHTFVSSSGSNGNPCTRSQPCATFQGAVNNTSQGGLITALDSAEYGQAISITQSVTIDGTGTQASIVMSSNTDAITINAGSTDTVTLCHMNLTGLFGANVLTQNTCDGVTLTSGNLVVDDCKISGFASYGLNLNSAGNTTVIDTIINGCFSGIFSNGAGLLSMRDLTLQGNQYGVDVEGGPADISHSQIAQNSSAGLFAFGNSLSASDCIISGNATGVYAYSGSTIRLTGNDLFNNTTGIAMSGAIPGIVSTASNNHKAGSATPGAPTPGKVIVTQ